MLMNAFVIISISTKYDWDIHNKTWYFLMKAQRLIIIWITDFEISMETNTTKKPTDANTFLAFVVLNLSGTHD